ncbi:GntR family transcriptional regulator [Parapusillimonas sp. SGNA-6]|nr:GntR family transcriptional regulator [Parapusillimonas sp. SGNA-6]
MFMTNADRVKAELENQIVSGVLSPGVTLDEAALCEMFDVSRTPVREALLQLSAEGFVRIVPRAGIYVVQLSAAELVDMFETLAYAESLCAKLAIERISPGQLKKLGNLQEAGKRAVADKDTEAYAQYNMAFHECVYASCGNRYLTNQMLYIRKRTNPYRQSQFDHACFSAEASWKDHQAMYEAFLKNDVQTAMRVASEHIAAHTRHFAELAETSPEHLFFAHEPSQRAQQRMKDMSRLFMPMTL